jgi:taurine dioxygenase
MTAPARIKAARAVAGPVVLRRDGEAWEPRPYQHLALRPLSPTIGAEVAGVDLGRPFAADVEDELRRALLEWKVLFFRDQHIDSVAHRDFAARWGRLEVHPFLPHGEVPEVVRFEKDGSTAGYENIWHADVTWKPDPPLGSVLRAIEVPGYGGDTLWADMGAAYDGLDDHVKATIDGLDAVHDFTQSFGQALEPAQLAEMQAKHPPATHPVVLRHPETGRRTLYVNSVFTDRILGIDPDEAEELLRLLIAQASVPEYQCRFRWTPGAVAFWDNRATQHYAVSDYFPARRVMERCTIVADAAA